MRIVGVLLLLSTAAAAEEIPGVANVQRAKMNWMLSCQGCHQADATGSANGAPSMAGEVARFLTVEGGREYLIRVPGVANAGMSDEQLAELLNWTLETFDKEHLPADFTPFTAGEVASGRAQPLVSEAAVMRETLRGKFAGGEASGGGN